MIDIVTLSENDINRKVVYRDRFTIEEGRITSFNEHFIFVDYQNVGRGQATSPLFLDFIETKTPIKKTFLRKIKNEC